MSHSYIYLRMQNEKDPINIISSASVGTNGIGGVYKVDTISSLIEWVGLHQGIINFMERLN